MPKSRSIWKRYLLAAAVLFTVAAFLGVFALCVTIDRHYGSNGTVVAVVAAAAVLAALVPLFTRESSPAPNYPRIEHLRIGGKFASSSAASVGISPLRLQQ